MSKLLEWGQQVLATQPFSKLLDAELVEFVEGRAELHIPITDRLVLHAGKTQAVCRCELFVVSGGEEKLCAAAQGTIVKVPTP